MGSFFEDLLLGAATGILGRNEINEIVINRIVNRSRNRPHPYSTREDYISWSGLTDRTYNARLLPPDPYPAVEAPNTRRPPIADVPALFAPPGGQQRLCTKSTCLFPAFAQYLTDGFIRTKVSNNPANDDRRRTTSNHEIDLSPLYGRTEAQTRVLRDTQGRLRSQIINGEEFPPFMYDSNGAPDPRFCDANGALVLDEPLGISAVTPAQKQRLFAVGGDRANATTQVAMMNTLFFREHNRLAGLISAQNAGWDDERVFQTVRNIVIVMFIKIVIEEYINHINTSPFRFIANPKVAWDARWNRPNWMTAEFSLLYRWHSLVPEQMTMRGASVPAAGLLFNNQLLIDHGLANAFVEVSANRATQLGLHNTASFLQRFEAMAISQARDLNIGTYAAYRRAMSYDVPSSFAKIVGRSDNAAEQARRQALAAELQALYGSVGNVEFYVGLFAEPNADNGPLPDLLTSMVAMDAFSQALTNPLLSRHVWGERANQRLAFTDLGLAEIAATHSLRDILNRNAP
ncbi:peroxidase family protein, partial [Blastomonas sp.]|uniref:peroxidase family protein n=1 Tax=Blastomonas sp. TaxID=1909299 RepID=UPI003593BC55